MSSANGGFTTSVIDTSGIQCEKTAWAKTTTDVYVGGYPNPATLANNAASPASGDCQVDLATAVATVTP